MEKKVSVDRGNDYYVRTSFIFPTNPGDFPLSPYFRSHSIGNPV